MAKDRYAELMAAAIASRALAERRARDTEAAWRREAAQLAEVERRHSDRQTRERIAAQRRTAEAEAARWRKKYR